MKQAQTNCAVVFMVLLIGLGSAYVLFIGHAGLAGSFSVDQPRLGVIPSPGVIPSRPALRSRSVHGVVGRDQMPPRTSGPTWVAAVALLGAVGCRRSARARMSQPLDAANQCTRLPAAPVSVALELVTSIEEARPPADG